MTEWVILGPGPEAARLGTGWLGCHWLGKDALSWLCGGTGVTDDAQALETGRWSPSDLVSAGSGLALPSNRSLSVPTWPPWGRFCRVPCMSPQSD